MFICENTATTVKVGPVQSRDGKKFSRKKLFNKEVMFCINSGSLANFAGGKDILVDLDGYYNVDLPPLTPGNLKIVVQLDGYPDNAFNFIVLSRHAYQRMFTNGLQEVAAINIPIENGYVLTDPNMVVGIDFEKTMNADAKLDMPNLRTGSVGEVERPHVTDLEGIRSTISQHDVASDKRHRDALVAPKAIQEQLARLNTDALQKQLGTILGNIKALQKSFESMITKEDVSKATDASVRELATSEELNAVVESLQAMQLSLTSLKIPSVEDFGGPLDTKNGRVKLAFGTDEGELMLQDGMVRVSDVQQKAGYSLAKDGIDSVLAKLEKHITKVVTSQMTRIEDQVKKKVNRGHH